MKKFLLFFFMIFIMVITPACKNIGKYLPNPTEIEDITIIKIVGMDKKDGKYKITAAEHSLQGGSKQQGAGGMQEDSKLIFGEGDTIFQAIRAMHTYTDQKVFLGRVEIIIIGEQAAKEEIREVMDFFTRDHEARLSAKVFVVKEASAEDILKGLTQQKIKIDEILKTLSEERGEISLSAQVSMLEVAQKLDSKINALYLPTISIIKDSFQTSNVSLGWNINHIGLGVFRDNKLLYYMNGYEARGANWVKGKVFSGIIIVKDWEGKNVSLEIIEARRKIKTYINNGIPGAIINIEMSSNIGEQFSTENIYDSQSIDYLRLQQEEIIKKEVLNIIKKAQNMNTDIFELGDTFYHQHPGKWRFIEDRWDELFPEMQIAVNVKSKINRVYAIREPNEYEKKKGQNK